MKKIYGCAIILALFIVLPFPVMAEVKIQVNIPLPPAIVFPVPPALIVIPETYVYAAPDIEEEIFFYGGWWWRPWQGRWYRSRQHDSGWAYYRGTPSFYSRIPPGWKKDYRDRQWKGYSWNYQRIPQPQLKKNWQGWERKKHWEGQNYWGVEGLRSRKPLSKGRPPRDREKPRFEHRPQQKFQGQQDNRR